MSEKTLIDLGLLNILIGAATLTADHLLTSPNDALKKQHLQEAIVNAEQAIKDHSFSK